MVQSTIPSLPPLVDDPAIKDVFVNSCVGISVVAGNAHLTFATVTADYTADPAPSRRLVSARVVIPLQGMIELRDILSQMVDHLTAHGLITPVPAPPTVITPTGRPN
jgi:hypothetical protein